MKNVFKLALIILISLSLTNCSSDDDGMTLGPTGESKTYILFSVSDPDISGTAKFIENNDNSTTIELNLEGTENGGEHPAHIHFNSAFEGGEIALTLGTVNGNTGFSTITTGTLNDGTNITYEEFLTFDGYINVHLSTVNLSTLIAQGNIGSNQVTVDSK